MSDESGKSGASEGTHAGEISPDPTRAAKVGSSRATVEAAMADLLGGVARPASPVQPSLMLDDLDEQAALFDGPVRHVAKTMDEAAGRGRGRPKGSQNKSAWRDTMLRMGYRHPGENLLAIANADPVELALELGGFGAVLPNGVKVTELSLTRGQLEALIDRAQGLIVKANAELLPYFEGKAPTTVNVNRTTRGVMFVGDMSEYREVEDAFIDLANVDAPDE